MVTNSQSFPERIQASLHPWQEALAEPAGAQQKVLSGLLQVYAQTDYGEAHDAGNTHNLVEYRRNFPVVTYADYQPLIRRVMAGELKLLLNEEPVGWAITRGTTQDTPKFIPMTPTDIRMRVSAGRAMMNYAVTTGNFAIFQGVNLNLNFPSVVGKIKMGDRELEYGYSSGIYVKHVSAGTPIRSLPVQDDIDALGGGKTIRDWEARFELAYRKCKDENVTMLGGVAPTAVLFGRYLKKVHNIYPKDLWKNLRIMTLGSVPGINTTYEPPLTTLYGKTAIREIYGATEGMFGQQMDENRAWVPNYDLYFFEVQTNSGIKMLCEMRPGEMGSLIVSTPILARYKIGDLLLAFRKPYFRCIGRDHWWTPLEYFWSEFMTLNFGRL